MSQWIYKVGLERKWGKTCRWGAQSGPSPPPQEMHVAQPILHEQKVCTVYLKRYTSDCVMYEKTNQNKIKNTHLSLPLHGVDENDALR